MYWAGQALVAAWETGEEMPFIFDTVMCKLEEPALLNTSLYLTSMSAFFVFQKYEWFLPAHGLGGFGSCQVWDIIKLMDYLTTRPDIDPTHIGMMGISLGGLLCPKFSMYLH